MSTIKILFLAPDPTDLARLRLGRELRDVQEKLDDPNKFELRDRWAVRPRDVLQGIVDFKPQIVHFSGHGLDTGELCFEDEQSNAQPIAPGALAALFNLASEHVKCVVINTCFAEAQAMAIAEHIPFVIGMKGEVEDTAAIEFASGFYTALEADPSIEKIERAFEIGRVAIQLSGFQDAHLKPVLIFGDPRNRFRSEIEHFRSRLQRTDAISANIFRTAMLEKGKRMGLSLNEADGIVNDVIGSIKEYQEKLKKYEEHLIGAMKDEFPLEEGTREALKFLQQEFALRDEDVSAIENKIIADPRYKRPESFFDRGRAQANLGEHQKAENYFTKAIELRSQYSGAHFERGISHFQMGNLNLAVEDYSVAITINSNWEGRSISRAYFERGFAYYYLAEQENRNENMEAAIRDWFKTCELRPTWSTAFYNLALAYSALDNHNDAINNYTKAIEINNDWGTVSPALAYYRRGIHYETMGDTYAAERDFEQAERLLIVEKPELVQTLLSRTNL